jgi:hypothetical protein
LLLLLLILELLDPFLVDFLFDFPDSEWTVEITVTADGMDTDECTEIESHDASSPMVSSVDADCIRGRSGGTSSVVAFASVPRK